MKTNHPLVLLLLLFTFLFLATGCSESKDEEVEPSKEELLVNKTWKVKRITRDGQDVTYQPDMLNLRNTLTRYLANGIYSETSPVHAITGTWRLAGNVLIHNPGTDSEENWAIDALTKDKLQITSTILLANGSSDVFTLELAE